MLTRPAIVLGCGPAGVAAAAALRSTGRDVVIVEADRVDDPGASRKGVPQRDQLHNLLTRAQQSFESLLPGFREGLLRLGCGNASVADETEVFELGLAMPKRSLGLRLMCAPRLAIEAVARELLLSEPGVEVIDGVRATALVLDGSRLRGVRVTGIADEVIEAPLVVDASGMTTQARRWLAERGFASPRIDESHPDQWYVTARVRRPETHIGDPTFWLTFPTPPGGPGGLVSPVGRDEWYVSLNGRSVDRRPRNYSEMIAFAAHLEDPAIAQLLVGTSPVEPPNVYRRPVARWHRYDLLAGRLLPGFLPIGDAVASLNPLFGQGLSVAGWQATELRRLLREADESASDLATLTNDYYLAAGRACSAAWSLGRLVDEAVIANTTSADGARRRYQALAERVASDPAFHRRYVGVWHLLEPASVLAADEAVA